eukprot:TRINITY_DN1803_c0_g1_i2.p1 TRINITY_DN1803_c0_g1~~TRINITY_DN1803_c0_g1_i2.p1  ORF type:complete len:256 (-),score=17.31 TRINITY_DN1803_c0_g1_i2:131-898(-)
MRAFFLLLFYCCSLIKVTQGHVALVFPPARKYELDYLDVFRTRTPCGMDKGDIKTSIPNGQNLDISWHLGYPHKGGFKIELYDKDENLVTTFTDDRFIGERTSQSFSYRVPRDFVCKDCTIRLIRQALDFGKTYQFQSCADVDIVNAAAYKETCSNRGSFSGGSCTCNKPYYFGARCEFMDECSSDSDCGGSIQGKCLDLGGTAYPRKQCFCKPGYFGKACSKESRLMNTIKISNFTDFQQYSFGTTTNFYWRLL